MADSVLNTRASISNYLSGYGGYGNVYISFSLGVRITIYDLSDPSHASEPANVRGKLECWCDQTPSAEYVADELSGTGGGFWNADALMWGDRNYTPQWNRLDNPAYDTESDAFSEMNAATGGHHFIMYTFCDAIYDGDFTAYQIASNSFSRDITTDDFNSDGSLKPLLLIRMIARSYDHSDSDPSYQDAAVVEQYNTIYTSRISPDSPDFDPPISFMFYPWGRKLSSDWKSCNRDYDTASANRSAYLRRKESGAWADVLNDLQAATANQMGFIKASGNWKMSSLYGSN